MNEPVMNLLIVFTYPFFIFLYHVGVSDQSQTTW